MDDDDIESRLTSWLATQLPDAEDLRVDGLDRVEFGHSAETLLLTVAWRDHDGEHREDVVIRIRPPEPGLLPPYDLGRQFEILRALEPTPVRSPRVWWYEGTGDVLERDFYVMEGLPGTVYERVIPQELLDDPERVRRMCEDMVDQIAAIHSVDLRASGLAAGAGGHGYLEAELDHWGGEVRRVQRGPLPGLERLEQVLRERRPEQCPTITLVHGDAKPGNFAFDEGGAVTAVFDWEMASVGDPLADIGWAEVLWVMPGSFTNALGTPSVDEFIARWEERTGISTQHREWYRAFQLFKMAVIGLVGARLFDDGHSDDLRFNDMAYGVPWLTGLALTDLGIEEELEPGPLFPRKERVAEARQKAAQR
jgi:aminoglycoside phosphotransferase (APT) family kinase protein